MKNIFALALACISLLGSDLCGQERTLAIVKPDAVKENHVGEILTRYEKSGFRIGAIRMLQLNEAQAKEFYAIHQGKPFFDSLVKFMTSGPCVALVLEGENAVQRNRDLIGALDKPGTLRALFGTNLTLNAVHGSDSLDNAKHEVSFFFPTIDIQHRFESKK